MKKEYIKKTLLRIKGLQDESSKLLTEFGIDLIEYNEGLISCLEESIVVLLAKDEKQFELIMDDIQWWLYEGVDKVITVNGVRHDVNNIDDYVTWLLDWYSDSPVAH